MLDHLNATNAPCLHEPDWLETRAEIEATPWLVAKALGIAVTEREKPKRSFTAIMTSTGKKTSEDREMKKAIRFEGGGDGSKAIRFDPEKDPKRILCTFPFTTTPQSAPDSRPGRAPATDEQTPAADHKDQPRAIESLAELWEVVGRRVVHSPKLHQDRQPPADRLELARAAQQRAIERHARHAPVLVDFAGAVRGDDNRIVDREFAHESWED